MVHGSRRRGSLLSGFTLVELLVVIGIIAILIGTLLPALSRSRDSARKAQCLSNLRQIAQAIVMYANENNGCLVPGWIANTTGGGPGIENYATILVGKKYLPASKQNDFDAQGSQGDSVFRCPDGIDFKHETGAGAIGLLNPTSKEDSRGAQFWRRQSTAQGLNTGIMVDTWYGINAYDQGNAQGANPQAFIDKQKPWPFRKFVIQADGTVFGEFSKVTKFRKAAELVLVFDGLRLLDADFKKVNARHNRQKMTNFLMADGHCESIETKSLPRGPGEAALPGGPTPLTQAQINNTASPPNLSVWAPWPYPKWRLDQ